MDVSPAQTEITSEVAEATKTSAKTALIITNSSRNCVILAISRLASIMVDFKAAALISLSERRSRVEPRPMVQQGVDVLVAVKGGESAATSCNSAPVPAVDPPVCVQADWDVHVRDVSAN